MSDTDTTEQQQDVPALPPSAATNAEARRRRSLRAALAAEAGYILSVRAG